jgi:hypothetical protein
MHLLELNGADLRQLTLDERKNKVGETAEKVSPSRHSLE